MANNEQASVETTLLFRQKQTSAGGQISQIGSRDARPRAGLLAEQPGGSACGYQPELRVVGRLAAAVTGQRHVSIRLAQDADGCLGFADWL